MSDWFDFSAKYCGLWGWILFSLSACTPTSRIGESPRPDPTNLLPNASFELPLGEYAGQTTNWADLLNPLTVSISSTRQQPKLWPPQRQESAAPHGTHSARIPLESSEQRFDGHLTSPLIQVRPGQSYTLSAFARSDAPSSSIRLGLWNRHLDWKQRPEVQSPAFPLTPSWQRYEISFVIASYFDRAVVDLIVTAPEAGSVWVDAVQLEEGSFATEFQTRYPVEAFLTGKRDPLLLHLQTEPLDIYVQTHNSRSTIYHETMTVTVRSLQGKEMLTETRSTALPPGHAEIRIDQKFPFLGEFRASVSGKGDASIGLEDYLFVVHPEISEDQHEVLVSREGQVEQLAAERIWLPWSDSEDRFADPVPNLTVTESGVIYVPVKESTLAVTADGGRSWKIKDAGRNVNSVLVDGSFLNVQIIDEHPVLSRSGDQGKTWERLGSLPALGKYSQYGPITQLRDGTLVWPVGFSQPGLPHAVHSFRSTDGGHAWSRGFPVGPTGEPAIIELQSGKLLAVIRNNLMPAPSAWEAYWEAGGEPWLFWQRFTGYLLPHHRNQVASVHKNILLAESKDGGVTWLTLGPGSHNLGEMHGSAVELPDGRIVLIYVHRVPWTRGGERAKISRDGGHTWDKELYYLNATHFYPGYSASCLLPPELADGLSGVILTVIGERARGELSSARLQAVRWRPL